MFLKLTKANDGKKARINVQSIVIFYEESYRKRLENSPNDVFLSGTLILMEEEYLLVRETPEEIDRLLASAYVTIKEAYENRTSKVPQYPTNSEVNDSEQLQSGSR
jgi:hypothetical protein